MGFNLLILIKRSKIHTQCVLNVKWIKAYIPNVWILRSWLTATQLSERFDHKTKRVTLFGVFGSDVCRFILVDLSSCVMFFFPLPVFVLHVCPTYSRQYREFAIEWCCLNIKWDLSHPTCWLKMSLNTSLNVVYKPSIIYHRALHWRGKETTQAASKTVVSSPLHNSPLVVSSESEWVGEFRQNLSFPRQSCVLCSLFSIPVLLVFPALLWFVLYLVFVFSYVISSQLCRCLLLLVLPSASFVVWIFVSLPACLGVFSFGSSPARIIKYGL